MSSSLYQIDKLCENNYDIWSIQMQSVLVHSELWEVTNGGYAEPDDNTSAEYVAWSGKNKKALATIILSVKPTQLNYIKNCIRASDAWKKLKEVYTTSGPIRKVSLYKKLANFSWTEGTTITQYINSFLELAEKLNEADLKVSDEFLVIIMLSSLPPEYEHFVVAMETRDKLPTLEVLKIKLIEESDRRQQVDLKYESSSQQAFLARNNNNYNNPSHSNNGHNSSNNFHSGTNNNNKFTGGDKFKCFNCGKRGHFAKHCRAKKNKDFKQQRSFALIAATNTNGLTKASWCVDSGATAHMCCDREMFVSFHKNEEKVLLACDTHVKTAGIGDVIIKANIDITLKNVLYVPSMIGNFISVSKATSNNLSVKFGPSKAEIIDQNNQVLLEATKCDNLYIFNNNNNSCINKLAYTSTSNIVRWHNRYGHLNFKNLTDLAKKQIVNGLNIKGYEGQMQINCHTCMRSKINTKKFPTASETRSTNILDLIHSDVCGPMQKTSIGGARYFLTFIDDKSRKIFIYFLKSKSEVFEKFKCFKNMVECQTGRKIKAIRSDNGKEYVNTAFNNFLEECGIKRQLTVPHTPQQNGVAERANRTIVEMARSMLIHSGVDEMLWAEAVNTAVYIRNRSTTRILGNETPYKIWSGKTPSVKHFRVFGSQAIGLDKQQQRKFAARGKKYIFVGYSYTAKAYRLYDKDSRKVIEKRDVLFDEDSFETTTNQHKVTLEINNMPEEINKIIGKQEEKREVKDEDQEEKEEVDNKNQEEEKEIDIKESKQIPVQQNEDEENEDSADESLNSDDMATAEESVDEENRDKSPPIGKGTPIGPGRPKLIRTGRPGRPRKQFNILNMINAKEEVLIPQTVAEAMNSLQADKWMKAMEEEHAALVNNETWSLMKLPKDQKVVGSRWVYALKRDENGKIIRYKARLVAKGFSQQLGVNYNETFSPVVRHATIRLIIAIAVEFELHLHQMDVSSAYLNSELEDEVYMSQPEMFVNEDHPNHVMKLNKALYGLKQSGRAWNTKLDVILKTLGFMPCISEPCLYINRQDGFNIITVYVDDLIIGSSNITRLEIIKNQISDQVKVVDGGPLHHFLGMEICRKGKTGEVSICQQQYIQKLLHQYKMNDCRPVKTPLDVGFQTNCEQQDSKAVDQTSYQSLIGALTHLAVLTRPDIIHSVSKLAQRNTNPYSEHMAAAKHILRYLSKTSAMKLTFKRTGEPVKGYVDADWGGDPADRKSYTGYAFVFANAVFIWESRKQPIVALSSTEAEYVALSLAAKEAVYIKKLFNEIGLNIVEPIEINGDNLSAQQLVKNPVFHSRSKHIEIKFHYVRSVYKNNDIRLNYIPSNELFADIFTKNLANIKHTKFVQAMGLN